MENFFALPEEKQKHVTSAGFYCFGKLGYKKTSAADVAKKSDISKAMVFYYFGNKKNLYLYLLDKACDLMETAIMKNKAQGSDDFFDCLISDIKSKEIVLNEYPSILRFLASVIREEDAEVIEEVTRIKKRGKDFHAGFSLTEIDRNKFKNTVNPEIVFDLTSSYMESLTGFISQDESSDMGELFSKAYDCIEMLKVNFYKEEYLEKR